MFEMNIGDWIDVISLVFATWFSAINYRATQKALRESVRPNIQIWTKFRNEANTFDIELINLNDNCFVELKDVRCSYEPINDLLLKVETIFLAPAESRHFQYNFNEHSINEIVFEFKYKFGNKYVQDKRIIDVSENTIKMLKH